MSKFYALAAPLALFLALLGCVQSPGPGFGPSVEELVWEKRIAAVFEDSNCPNPKSHSSAYYSGKMIDSHFHIQSIPDGAPSAGELEVSIPKFWGAGGRRQPNAGVDITIGQIACSFDYEGTSKAIAFFPVFPDISNHALKVAKRAMEEQGGKFYPFIMPPDSDNKVTGSPTVDAATLKKMLAVHPGLFNGYGEIGLYERENGSRELPPDSGRLLEIYPVLRENGLVAYFHLGAGHEDNFAKILKENPDLKFIFHGDQLITQNEAGQDLSKIEELIASHSNVYYTVDELYGDEWLLHPDVSKEEFLEHFRDYEPLLEEDLATWRGIIEKYPDQFMWGTDRGWSAAWSVDHEVGWTLNDYGRAFISRLKPEVREKFAYKNAQRVMGSD